MSLQHSPGIVTNGLVFAYDMGNPNKSWLGQPTTNLVGDGMSIYNNVSSDVSITLTATSEKYKGATVYKQVIKPITATGVSYLTAGNNPGIGVISSGGGGTASRYTGHAIFYKPTTAMHSTPLFTNYSNIGGWGAGSLGSNRSVSMGDGWFRGEVIWYDTVTRSDGKYWAINPANVALNVPITVYWGGPFKEDRNDSTMVAQYTTSTRSNTQALIDLTGTNTITASSLTYASDGTFSFNGSSDYITIPNTTLGNGNVPWTVSAWVKTNTTVNALGQGSVLSNSSGGPVYSMMGVNAGKIVYWTYQNAAWVQKLGTGKTVNDNTWHLLTWVNYNNYTMDMYVDGVLDSNVPNSTSGNNNPVDRIGGSWAAQFNGSISSLSRYNRALSAAEVKQNFNALRGRYGI